MPEQQSSEERAEKRQAQIAFDYAIVRVVPRVEREEFVNVGVIVFARTEKFLAARTHCDDARLIALFGNVDREEIHQHLASIQKIAEGSADSGPIGALPVHERWHWLVAPRSTIIQVSPVHSGLSMDLAATLEHLVRTLVG